MEHEVDLKLMDSALSKAKIKIIGNPKVAFYSRIMMGLKYEWADIETTDVDGTLMRISPQFWAQLNVDTRQTVLLHEVEHIVRMHLVRVGNRDHAKYNRAGDYIINNGLDHAGFKAPIWLNKMGLPCTWLMNHQYDNMDTEQVYDLLPDVPPPPPSGMPMPTPFDDLKKPEDDAGGTMSDAVLEAKITELILDAAISATMAGEAGSIPGEVQVWIDSLLKPKLPLCYLLRKFFEKVPFGGYTWARPNRRYRPQGVYLPTRRGKSLIKIAVAFDMSGSVTDEDTKRYMTEVHDVLVKLKPDVLTLIQFDTCVKSVHSIKSASDLMNMHMTGRGGTDVRPVIQWAADNKPNALLIFSDGEFRIPNDNPNVPIMWLIHGRNPNWSAPFGQVLYFKAK